jgi:hypothetical protein
MDNRHKKTIADTARVRFRFFTQRIITKQDWLSAGPFHGFRVITFNFGSLVIAVVAPTYGGGKKG